ncbi:MAG: glycosyltransferase family 4 protein [Nitrososphaerota archaeon]|nr:glycosyltransferase family 4 protein [Nitrososphaerota archaeon]
MSLVHDVHVLRFNMGNRTSQITNCKVHQVPHEYLNSNPAVYYSLNLLSHKLAIQKLCDEFEFDAVINSNILPVFSTIKHVQRSSVTVLDLADHFPTSAVGYFVNLGSPVGKAAVFTLESAMRHIIRHTDVVVPCAPFLADYSTKMGAKKTCMIPNGVGDIFFDKDTEDHPDIRASFGMRELDFVLGFVGMIEFWLDFDPVIGAMKYLIEEGLEIKLFLVGGEFHTNQMSRIREKAERAGIQDHLRWTNGWVPYGMLPRFIQSMDACLIPFNLNYDVSKAAVPNKLWEYFALGKPVISTKLPGIMSSPGGSLVKYATTTEEYYRVIRELVVSSKSPVPEEISLAYKRSWSSLARQYEALLYAMT